MRIVSIRAFREVFGVGRPAPTRLGVRRPAAARLCVSVATLLAVLIASSGAWARVVINEVHYDPDGPDAGREWVELYNAGPWPVSLAGFELEFGNGSDVEQWNSIWRGRGDQWIGAGGFLWIGGTFGGRDPDIPAELGLQNGPDGIRLLREGFVLDRLGWGELVFPEYYEGAPAPGTPSGQSLARSEDGMDRDDNALDFVAAAPSPGRPNAPVRDLALHLAEGFDPLPLSIDTPGISVPLRITNRGREAVDLATVGWWAGGVSTAPEPHPSGSLGPGDTRSVTLSIPSTGPEGTLLREIRLTLPGDQVPENDADSLRVWRGSAPVRLTEIYPRPRAEETEWIELEANRAIDLEAWTVRDADGHGLELAAGSALAPGEVCVLAPREAVFPESTRTLAYAGSWPSLNDGRSGASVADSVFVRDPTGVVVDWAVYGNADRGLPWRRLARDGVAVHWYADEDAPGGGPGRAEIEPATSHSSGAERPGTGFLSTRRHPGGVWIALDARAFPGAWSVEVFDLRGRRRWRSDGRAARAETQWCLWNGRDAGGERVPVGVYVVRSEVVGESGERQVEAASLAVVP